MNGFSPRFNELLGKIAAIQPKTTIDNSVEVIKDIFELSNIAKDYHGMFITFSLDIKTCRLAVIQSYNFRRRIITVCYVKPEDIQEIAHLVNEENLKNL